MGNKDSDIPISDDDASCICSRVVAWEDDSTEVRATEADVADEVDAAN